MKIGIFNVALAGLLNLSHFMKGIENWNFEYLRTLYFQIFPNLLKSLKELRFLNFPHFHILSDCEDCLSATVYVMERQGGGPMLVFI